MDKRDIYEHLANIYLDASSNKKKKNKKKHRSQKYLFSSVIVLVLLGFVYFVGLPKNNLTKASEVALVLYPDTAKINFNFDPAKKEIFAINLNRLNLKHYKSLSFSVKKSNFNDKLSLRVEFVNAFRERSHIYLKNIPHKWQGYQVNFSDFKDISYWGEMSNLSFIVEEWNAKDKRDVVYIDNIRVLR